MYGVAGEHKAITVICGEDIEYGDDAMNIDDAFVTVWNMVLTSTGLTAKVWCFLHTER